MAATIKTYGGLDILVNNAGIEICALVENTTVEQFQHILDVNVTGVFLGLKHGCRAMKPVVPPARAVPSSIFLLSPG